MFTFVNLINCKGRQNFNNECPRGVMFKPPDCVIVVRVFQLYSPNFVHFRVNNFAKVIDPQILLAMGKIALLQQGELCH